MSRSRPRGLVIFALIGLIGLIALVALFKVMRPGGGERASGGAGPGGSRALVKGTGTTWLEEETPKETSAALEGVVLDGEGRPIDGARVTLSRARGRNEEGGAPFSFMQPRAAAVTSDGGRFRIDKLPAGEYRATAMAEGWAPAHRPIEIAEKQTARVELKLAAGGLALEGRVLDIGGGAVGGARITAFGRTLASGGAPVLFQATSNGDGHYKMMLARGPYMLRAEAEGYAGASENELVLRPTTRDLRLVPAARITGQVIERGSGQPVPGAEVTLTTALRSDWKPPREARADDGGRFEFTGLEPGRYEVMGRKGVLIGAGEIVGLAVAQAVDDVQVKLDRGYSISGRVKDEQGKGVGNTRLSAARDTPPWGQAARTRTNADGSYALEGLLPGTYRLNASDEGFGPGQARAKLLSSNLTNVDIVVPPASKVMGRVLSAAGQPVEGARVNATYEVNMGGGGMMQTGETALSAADGSFEMKRAMAGTMRINARHDELGSVALQPEPLRAGETRRLELRLKAGGSISGVVRDDQGKPAAGVRITVMARELRAWLDAQDVTGPDGQYRVSALPAGRITVSAERSGRPSFGMEDQPDQKTIPLADGEQKTGVDLVVGPAGLAIRGMAVDAQGKPVAGALVSAAPERDGRAFRGNARDLKAYTDLDGNFTLNDLARGTYTVWGVHPDHPEAEAKGVSPGPGVVQVKFPASASVAGVVVLPDGKPVPHYSITILPGPGANERPEEKRRRQMGGFDLPTQQVQDPSGQFELRRLAGASHELVVSTADGATASQVVTLQPGEKKTGIRIQVVPGLRVTGRVVEYGTNRPMPGVGIYAMGTGNSRATTDTGADGSFVLEGAPAGETLRLSVSTDREKYVPEFKEVDIKPGQTTADAGIIKLIQGNQRERFDVPPGERGSLGIATKRDGEHVVLTRPLPQSAAEKAGLKQGDALLAIDGKDTSDLGNGALNYLLGGKTGSNVTLTVTSAGGQPRQVTLTREAPPAPKPPPTGVSIAR
jgi:protocatechuate 3,4-dioxygenase beta subunit/5-hydroxyisourate hydrolase-like protein (transthyretin family)